MKNFISLYTLLLVFRVYFPKQLSSQTKKTNYFTTPQNQDEYPPYSKFGSYVEINDAACLTERVYYSINEAFCVQCRHKNENRRCRGDWLRFLWWFGVGGTEDSHS